MNTVLRYKWTKLVSGATNSTAFATDGSDPKPTTSIPTGAGSSQAINMDNFPGVRFAFGGVGDDGQTCNYRIIAWQKSETAWYPTVMASGAFTVSAMLETAGGLDTATVRLADTITESQGLPGVSVISPANNTLATITVFPGTALYVTVETDRGTLATSASVYWVPVTQGEVASLMANIEANLGNAGLLNKLESEIDPAVSVAEDTAHTSGEAINPMGGVRTDTRASLVNQPNEWGPVQFTANGDVRVRDDDLNTLMAVGTGAMASAQAVTLATDDTQFGEVGAAADVDGNIHAQLYFIGDAIEDSTIRRGAVIPQADVTVDEAWETAIAIAAHVVAVRVYVDDAMYCVVNSTAGNPSNTGPPVPADRLVDIPCVNCTYLHVGKVAGNVALKYGFVYKA